MKVTVANFRGPRFLLYELARVMVQWSTGTPGPMSERSGPERQGVLCLETPRGPLSYSVCSGDGVTKRFHPRGTDKGLSVFSFSYLIGVKTSE